MNVGKGRNLTAKMNSASIINNGNIKGGHNVTPRKKVNAYLYTTLCKINKYYKDAKSQYWSDNLQFQSIYESVSIFRVKKTVWLIKIYIVTLSVMHYYNQMYMYIQRIGTRLSIAPMLC